MAEAKAKIVLSVSVTDKGKPQFAKMDVVVRHSQNISLILLKRPSLQEAR